MKQISAKANVNVAENTHATRVFLFAVPADP